MVPISHSLLPGYHCFGQKGGVAKTCSSVHIAASWVSAKTGRPVDADRNRSATAYGAKASALIVPIEAAAKATRLAEIVITDERAPTKKR